MRRKSIDEALEMFKLPPGKPRRPSKYQLMIDQLNEKTAETEAFMVQHSTPARARGRKVKGQREARRNYQQLLNYLNPAEATTCGAAAGQLRRTATGLERTEESSRRRTRAQGGGTDTLVPEPPRTEILRMETQNVILDAAARRRIAQQQLEAQRTYDLYCSASRFKTVRAVSPAAEPCASPVRQQPSPPLDLLESDIEHLTREDPGGRPVPAGCVLAEERSLHGEKTYATLQGGPGTWSDPEPLCVPDVEENPDQRQWDQWGSQVHHTEDTLSGISGVLEAIHNSLEVAIEPPRPPVFTAELNNFYCDRPAHTRPSHLMYL